MRNTFATITLLSFFICGLLTESMEVVAVVMATIVIIAFVIGIKNEIAKLRRELADKKKLES
jgi:ABC-type proline/glycine betaine transport system permease subunit